MADESAGARALRRVWAALPPPARHALETTLPPTDLQTALIAVARARASRVSPAQVLRRWSDDRLVRPSGADPRALAELETTLWRMLPRSFAGVDLSPVVPLGTCAALGPVNQDRIVSTMRAGEVLSDPTNALAVEAARRRRDQRVLRQPVIGAATGDPVEPAGGVDAQRIDVAAHHRVLRAQRFGPGDASHFTLFALVSTARDTGSGLTEARLLIDHLAFWQLVLAELVPARAWLTVTAYGPGVLAERLRDTVLPALSAGRVPVMTDSDRTHGAGYYAGAAIGLRADRGGAMVDLGDGGVTTWTAQLLGDRKERCVTSCLSTERLLALRTPSS